MTSIMLARGWTVEASGVAAAWDRKSRIEDELQSAAREALDQHSHGLGDMALQAAALLALNSADGAMTSPSVRRPSFWRCPRSQARHKGVDRASERAARAALPALRYRD
jgi:hypothetical protein